MDETELARLQTLLFEAALRRTSLPGINRALDFPDLQAIRDQDVLLLSTENLARPEDFGDNVRLVDPGDIAAMARERGPFPYLRFQPPERGETRVGLSLQLVTGFADVEPLPLGAVVANFEPAPDGGWIAVEPTAALAY